METKKFWCHYIGNDGNTPKRRSIELTKFDGIIPFNNNNVKTPIWCEIEEDEYNKDKHRYPLYVQLSDNVALYIRSIVSEEYDVNPAKMTEEEIIAESDRLYEKWINPNMSDEAKARQREYADDRANDRRKHKEHFFKTLNTVTDYTNYLLFSANWITASEIRAYEEINHPFLSGLKVLREKFIAEREAKEEERKRKAEEERKAKEEEERLAAIAEAERLAEEEKKFAAGNMIDGDDLADLCKKHNIKVHLRTIHNLRDVIVEINGTGQCRYYRRKGKRPVLDGCYKAASDLYDLLTNK